MDRRWLDKLAWLPIEEAPRDGTEVLLFEDRARGYAAYIGSYDDADDTWWSGLDQVLPCGWLPLPDRMLL